MKSLNIIQTLAKIGRIICIVLFILGIIGAAGSVLGLSLFPIMQGVIVAEPNKTLADYLLEKGIRLFDVYSSLAIAIAFSGLSIFLCKYTELLLNEQIKLGTPFDHSYVKKMRKYALISVITCVCVNILVAVILALVGFFTQTKFTYNAGSFSTIGWGIAILILSLFCEYGADLLHPAVPAPASDEEETSTPKSE